MVLEVVEVPEDGLPVERGPGIGPPEVDPVPALDLEAGEDVEDPPVQGEYRVGKRVRSRLARLLDRVEEGRVAEVLEEPHAGLLVRPVHLGHGQPEFAQRAGVGEKGPILHRIGSVGAHGGRPVPGGETPVAAGGAVRGDGADVRRRFAVPLEEERRREVDQGVAVTHRPAGIAGPAPGRAPSAPTRSSRRATPFACR